MSDNSLTGIGAIGATVTNGIQDISALLPLLGTEQCETHVGSALSEGWLYVAATPLSIFGSLGIARAGFKALLAGSPLRGSKFLRNSGFKPSGTNLSLIMLDKSDEGAKTENRDRHLAETNIMAKLDRDAHRGSPKAHCALFA